MHKLSYAAHFVNHIIISHLDKDYDQNYMQAVLATLNKWFENFYKNKLYYYSFPIIKYVLISNSSYNNKTNGIGTTVLGLHIGNNHIKSIINILAIK
jgi:hypothetical protein